jgi:hypothetical protein
MPVDPASLSPGKRYVTQSRHIRTVLEVTEDRVRFAYGGSESGGVPQWRWQSKDKFAADAVRELPESSREASEPSPIQQESSNGSKPASPKEPGARKTLTKRP